MIGIAYSPIRQIFSPKGLGVLRLFWVKQPIFTFCEPDFSDIKLKPLKLKRINYAINYVNEMKDWKNEIRNY